MRAAVVVAVLVMGMGLAGIVRGDEGPGLWMPVVVRGVTWPLPTYTPTPTETGTPAATATATRTATATATATATNPAPHGGDNEDCRQQGAAQLCAWVSDGSPVQSQEVTVYARLYVGGVPVMGAAVHTAWHYKTTTPTQDCVTGADGVGACTRNIGRATLGYRVDVDVQVDGVSAETWFVPG